MPRETQLRKFRYMVWDPYEAKWILTSRYVYLYLKRRWFRNRGYKFALQRER